MPLDPTHTAVVLIEYQNDFASEGGALHGAVSATVSQYPYTIGTLGVEACLAAASGEPLPARVDAPIQVVTRRNVARAKARFPQPVRPFESPFATLLGQDTGR